MRKMIEKCKKCGWKPCRCPAPTEQSINESAKQVREHPEQAKSNEKLTEYDQPDRKFRD